MILRALVIAVVALAMTVVQHVAAESLQYEPAVVQLTGILNVEDHFGPPNYGENPDEDRVERAYVLRLDRRIDVVGKPSGDLNTASFTDVERVHLVPGSQPLGAYVGQHMTVEGTLFEGFTGHHVTDVLMRVSNVLRSQKIQQKPLDLD